MKIVVLDGSTLGEVSLEGLERFGTVEVHGMTAPGEVAERIRDAEVVLTNKVVLGGAELAAAPGLKLICVTATGYNNIDTEAARARNVAVSNVAGYSTPGVVSHTFAMAFRLLFGTMLDYYDGYCKNQWAQSYLFTNMEMPFHDLSGLQWGVIGMGTIGQKVIKAAKAFDCTVAYHSTSGENTSHPYRMMTLDFILGKSDIVSIHAPLNEKTKGLIGEEELKMMKPEAILINVGRGGIVDEAALAKALREGWIAGAGVDVVSTEPPAADNPLLDPAIAKKLVMTPHIAWGSIESRAKLMEEIEANIEAFANGEARNRIV